jgi:hypothetical protein
MSRAFFLPLLSALSVVVPSAAPYGQSVSPEVSGHAATAPLPDADAILEQALDRAAAQDTAGLELDFESLLDSTVESLNGDGDTTDIETARYRRYPLVGLLYEELIARDGRPLDDEEAREEAERRAEFVEEARKHADRGEPYDPNEMAVRFNRELMDRYDTALIGTEFVGVHTCWVLSFEPREGRLPDNQRMDKALNRSTGRLWIAQDDYGVARVSFEMQEPFRYVWGLVATLRHATGQLEYERVDHNLWTLARFDLELDLRVFFKGIRRRIRQVWIEHSRIGEFVRSS